MSKEVLTEAAFRKIFKGSFLLSPGRSSGHLAIAWLCREAFHPLNANLGRSDIFGIENPEVELITPPNGHTTLVKGMVKQQSEKIWEQYLTIFFKPSLKSSREDQLIRLIEVNAGTDLIHFERRRGLQGVKFSNTVEPSLLRFFVLENNFPSFYRNTVFYQTLLESMSHSIIEGVRNNYPYMPNLLNLYKKWNSTFPKTPFIPEK